MKHPATPQDRLYGATNINAGVGFWQEHKADTAIAALKANLALKARVLRDGKWRTLSASELVPGDVIELHLGNIVPADVVLAQGQYLSVDQSALTGESLPVDKKVGDVAYSGSVAKMGEMKAAVTSTGMDTYFGKTARRVETAGNVSHFQKAVMDIGDFLILSTLAAVYGVSMSPIGWKYAGLVWGYALLWFFIADIVKVFVFKLMNLHQSRVPARAAKIKATAIT